jgi:hypothetical protein
LQRERRVSSQREQIEKELKEYYIVSGEKPHGTFKEVCDIWQRHLGLIPGDRISDCFARAMRLAGRFKLKPAIVLEAWEEIKKETPFDHGVNKDILEGSYFTEGSMPTFYKKYVIPGDPTRRYYLSDLMAMAKRDELEQPGV